MGVLGALALVAAFVVTAATAAAAAAAEYNVVDYGARPGGRADAAKAFLAAWAAACGDAGGDGGAAAPVMRVPAGRVPGEPGLLQGAVPEPRRRGGGRRRHRGRAGGRGQHVVWIMFHYADGLELRGGTLDGRGQAHWACRAAGRPCPPGTTTLDISQSKNVSIKRLTLRDSKNAHISIFDCAGVTLQGVTIAAPADSPNTDGVHLQLSTGVRVLSSAIGTGDDCVSLGPGTSDVLRSSGTSAAAPATASASAASAAPPARPGCGTRRWRAWRWPARRTASGSRRGGCRTGGSSPACPSRTSPCAACRTPSSSTRSTAPETSIAPASTKFRGEDHGRIVHGHRRDVGDGGGGEVRLQRREPVHGDQSQGVRDVNLTYQGKPAQSLCKNAHGSASGVISPPSCL
ncbi:hypothetical protein ACP4OV_015128 [Aristida adscensionis]